MLIVQAVAKPKKKTTPRHETFVRFSDACALSNEIIGVDNCRKGTLLRQTHRERRVFSVQHTTNYIRAVSTLAEILVYSLVLNGYSDAAKSFADHFFFFFFFNLYSGEEMH